MKLFRYQVHNPDGYVEMEVFLSEKSHCVKIHYPRIESFPLSSPLLADRSSFKEMRFADFGYMLFAYNEDEFLKFDAFLKEQLKAES